MHISRVTYDTDNSLLMMAGRVDNYYCRVES